MSENVVDTEAALAVVDGLAEAEGRRLQRFGQGIYQMTVVVEQMDLLSGKLVLFVRLGFCGDKRRYQLRFQPRLLDHQSHLLR